MSVFEAQNRIYSHEFSEWIAFYVTEAELQDPERAPDPGESARRFHAAVLAHNASLAARGVKS
jgi:hypothetical protein